MSPPAGALRVVLWLAYVGTALAVPNLAHAAAGPGLPQRRAEVTPEQALLAAWDGGFGEWVEELTHDGRESVVLRPLAQHPAAAMHLVRHLRGSDRLLQRKLAAMLVGFLGPAAPGGVLDELFEAEATRDRACRSDPEPLDPQSVVDDVVRVKTGRERDPARRAAMERLDAQSVVEDVVFAGMRWCRYRERKTAGVTVLRKVVESTIDGQYWNSTSAAMQGLVCGCRADAHELLTRFSLYAAGKPPDQPSGSSLDHERHVAEALGAGGCDKLRAVGWDDKADAADQATDEERARIEPFLGLARAVKQTKPARHP